MARAKAKTRTRYLRRRRSGGRRKKSLPIATIGGALMTGYQIYDTTRRLMTDGSGGYTYTAGEAFIGATTALRKSATGWTFYNYTGLVNSWGPLLVGSAISQFIGSTSGFGTGAGLGLNKHLPGRIKI